MFFKRVSRYICYIVILFVTDEATIKAKRFICFLKESRVTLSFVVKSKLVTVLSLFLHHSQTIALSQAARLADLSDSSHEICVSTSLCV